MASNDGSRLTVFGLTFRQHDNRQMQQILRAYGRLPANPGNRAALYTGLFGLSKSLREAEAEGIERWLQNGGHPDDFPDPPKPATATSVTKHGTGESWSEEDDIEDKVEDDGKWSEYHSAALENDDVEMGGTLTQVRVEVNEILQPNDNDSSGRPQTTLDAVPEEDEITGSNMDDVDFQPPRIPYKESENPKNECQVCYELMASASLLAPSKLTSTCNHDSGIRSCFQCLMDHINITLERLALYAINCPFCDETLSPEEIKQYASPEGFARYEHLLFIANKNTVMCLMPSCGARQTHVDPTNHPKMICNSCSFATCVNHNLPWHEGVTCEDFDCDETQIERLEQAEATAKLLAKDQTKICPSCKQGVTKQDGCDHLSCLCGKAWCFVCLASWENIMRIGPEAHGPTCDYHPRKRQKTKAQQAAGQAQMTESLLGAPASEALLKAREARNERVRADIRPKALEAAEARMKAERERAKEDVNQNPDSKKRKVRLLPAWEEQ